MGGVLDSDQSLSPVVILNERVETSANIRDWPKEESEWRDDATLVRLSSVCRPHLTPPLSQDTASGGQVLDMAITPKSVTDLSLSRLSNYQVPAMISDQRREFV